MAATGLYWETGRGGVGQTQAAFSELRWESMDVRAQVGSLQLKCSPHSVQGTF